MATITRNADQLPQESRFCNRMIRVEAANFAAETTVDNTFVVQVPIPQFSRLRDFIFTVPTPFRSADGTIDTLLVAVSDSVGAAFINNTEIFSGGASQVRLAQMDRQRALTLTSTNGTAAAASASLANLAAEAEKIGDDVRLIAAAPNVGRINAVAGFTLNLTFTPKTGKAMSAYNVGALELFFELHTFDNLG